ncbi:unnamed protein product [Caenorhabditis auriculariae]|uniref:AAA+ ATPase domain-containing protein n=1 Tax=Caenorhabditis auriculariae TaxID=2777116 RepID=A0A8S1H1C5_9PELO|nr:unnamed protein product [Caenorhabditis auriculariae]
MPANTTTQSHGGEDDTSQGAKLPLNFIRRFHAEHYYSNKEECSHSTWLKKYEPKKITELVGRQISGPRIAKLLGNFDYFSKRVLVLKGPEGAGKATICRTIANGYFNDPEEHKQNVCVIYAAKENRDIIDTVRNFCDMDQPKPVYGRNKLFIIHDIDLLSANDMELLMTTIDWHVTYENCGFVLTCQTTKPVGKSLLSTSIKVNLDKFSRDDVIERLNQLVRIENIEVPSFLATKVANSCAGNLGSAISTFQHMVEFHLAKTKKFGRPISDAETYFFVAYTYERPTLEEVMAITRAQHRDKARELISFLYSKVGEDPNRLFTLFFDAMMVKCANESDQRKLQLSSAFTIAARVINASATKPPIQWPKARLVLEFLEIVEVYNETVPNADH